LPGNARGEILDDQAVAGAGAGGATPRRRRATTESVVSTPIIASSAASTTTRPTGVLHHHAGPLNRLAVEVVNGVFGVTRVLKLHECKAVFDKNIA